MKTTILLLLLAATATAQTAQVRMSCAVPAVGGAMPYTDTTGGGDDAVTAEGFAFSATEPELIVCSARLPQEFAGGIPEIIVQGWAPMGWLCNSTEYALFTVEAKSLGVAGPVATPWGTPNDAAVFGVGCMGGRHVTDEISGFAVAPSFEVAPFAYDLVFVRITRAASLPGDTYAYRYFVLDDVSLVYGVR